MHPTRALATCAAQTCANERCTCLLKRDECAHKPNKPKRGGLVTEILQLTQELNAVHCQTNKHTHAYARTQASKAQ